METMELAVLIGLAAILLLALAALAIKPRVSGNTVKEHAWLVYQSVADEVGGLMVTANEDGWPRLEGLVDGLPIEIDHTNQVAMGLDGMLGMRCRLPEAEMAPNAAVWIGRVDALHTQYGRPRSALDGTGLFEVYTRVDPSASDWWQEPELYEALSSLPGAGVLLDEGHLTVVFSDLDAESVRTAMTIPGLIRRGVSRVTIH